MAVVPCFTSLRVQICSAFYAPAVAWLEAFEKSRKGHKENSLHSPAAGNDKHKHRLQYQSNLRHRAVNNSAILKRRLGRIYNDNAPQGTHTVDLLRGLSRFTPCVFNFTSGAVFSSCPVARLCDDEQDRDDPNAARELQALAVHMAHVHFHAFINLTRAAEVRFSRKTRPRLPTDLRGWQVTLPALGV